MGNLNDFKISLTAALFAVGSFLGWQGIMLLVWVALMLVDYLSGTLAAKTAGNWSSRIAREGIMHKGGMVLVVLVSGLADLVICAVCEQIPLGIDWPVLVLPLVLMWYILTEIGSILENAGKLGAPVPKWFAAALDAGLRVVDSQGEEIAGRIAEDKREQEGIE